MKVRAHVGMTLVALILVAGCDGTTASVRGRVTCQGKPVAGAILFSPIGDRPENTGPAVNTALDDEGRFKLDLKTTGSHRLVVSPRDMPAKIQEKYHCDLAPVVRDVHKGENEIIIELPKRNP